MREPIVISCEGSGWPTHKHGCVTGVCSMCGQLAVIGDDGRAYKHNRQDVLAMLQRGDFDMPIGASSGDDAE